MFFSEVSGDFSLGYKDFMKINSIAGTVRGMTILMNRSTDLFHCKAINEKRRQRTATSFKQALSEADATNPFPSDLVKFEFKDVSFKFQGEDFALRDINLTVKQGSMVAVVAGSHSHGRNTFLKLIAQVLFPTKGDIFIPSHLRILRVSQDIHIFNTTVLANLTMGNPDADIEHVKAILVKVQAWRLLEEIDRDPYSRSKFGTSGVVEDVADVEEGKAGCWSSCCSVLEEQPVATADDDSWVHRLHESSRAKLHLARALIANTEIMVLHRPLLHFYPSDQSVMLEVLHEHVKNRGLGLPSEHLSTRRPRTMFVSVEHSAQAKEADIIWTINGPGERSSVTPVSDTSLLSQLTP